MKPCPNPACGEPDNVESVNRGGAWWIRCDHCGLAGPVSSVPHHALALWDGLPRISTK